MRLTAAIDPYYSLARRLQGQDRKALASSLRQLHQSAVDEAILAACQKVDEVLEGQQDLAESVKNAIRLTYLAGGHISDDRRAIAKTEAILYAVVNPMGVLAYDEDMVNMAYKAGHGVDICCGEVVPQPGKFAQE